MVVGEVFVLTKQAKILNPADFELTFTTPEEVYCKKDLSPLPKGVCINVLSVNVVNP
jgi:hypothetical protein